MSNRPDWGLNWPADVVIRCFQFLDNWGVLPEAGGILDQDPDLLDDILHLYWLKEYHTQRVKQPEKPKPFKDFLKRSP